ncbi:MAG: alpha/beta hydrolase [Parafilimonas sp.]
MPVKFGGKNYTAASLIFGFAALIFYTIPFIYAVRITPGVEQIFADKNTNEDKTPPFEWSKLVTGLFAKQASYQTLTYDTAKKLTLDFYPSFIKGNQPCILVVHGGSWSSGDSQQLPELNSELAKRGYNVASINYRLAPQYKYPAPVEDVKSVFAFLREHGKQLSIDTNQFVLLGRSAGGQIALSAAYTLHDDAALKGVICFYAPVDMVWGYANPTNPLVLDSRQVMSDYLGGTYKQVPQQYIASSGNYTARANVPPALLIYGQNDPLVSYLHAVRLSKKLDSLSVLHYNVYLPWATHGFDFTLNGPGGQISTWCVLQFVDKITIRQNNLQ